MNTVVHAVADRGVLAARVRARLVESGAPPTPAAVAAAVRHEGHLVGDDEILALSTALEADIHGLGPLEPLVHEVGVTDVLVNGPGEVWVDRGAGLVRAPVAFASDAEVRALAQRIAGRCGRRLDDAAPWVDARLPDGTRVHAVLRPVSPTSTLMSVRVPRRRAFTMDELVAAGSMPSVGADWLRAIVRGRLAFLLSGGTGTGKTTMLSTLLGEVDPRERIVMVEDVSELRPDHPHAVGLEARAANVEEAGSVTMRDLVRQALRMRPDRLVVGEARGAEVVDLLGALNTGHEGGCATVHANAASDVPARLEALGMLAGISRDAMHAQVHAALDAVVHLVRRPDGRRQVAEIGALDRGGDGRVEVLPAVIFGADGSVRPGPGEPLLRRRIESR